MLDLIIEGIAEVIEGLICILIHKIRKNKEIKA